MVPALTPPAAVVASGTDNVANTSIRFPYGFHNIREPLAILLTFRLAQRQAECPLKKARSEVSFYKKVLHYLQMSKISCNFAPANVTTSIRGPRHKPSLLAVCGGESGGLEDYNESVTKWKIQSVSESAERE